LKIGITGHNGFIGKNLKKHLSTSGYQVECFNVDLSSSVARELLYPYSNLNAIVHMAGKNKGEDKDIIKANVKGTINLLNFCLKWGTPVMVAGSTYALDCAYKTSKDAVDILCKSYSYLGLNSIVLNIPKVFGYGCKPFYNSFVTTLIHSAAYGYLDEQIKFIDDTSKTLEVIHVDDLCNEIEMHLDCIKGYRKINFNEDNGLIKITIEELISILKGNEKHRYSKVFLETVGEYKNEISKT
jgi:UDP-2-acetamido-2,6-beta-L-arabino-hexul-4-ose reductase